VLLNYNYPKIFLVFLLFFAPDLFSQNGSDDMFFLTPSGFYEDEIDVELNTDNGEIYFTTDGSIPTLTSLKYVNPIHIAQTTVIRARILLDGTLSDETGTNTYFINEHSTLPVFSISTNPENFWDADSGIYVEGNNYNPDDPIGTANYWKDWEKPIHIEFYETDASLAFEQDAGVKIFGSWSRTNDQKSLAIHAREMYGTKKIYYQLFPSLNISKYKKFVLRNSGTDWFSTMFRDGFMQSLVENQNLDILAYRPAIVFLNGKYWGIHNIREKVSDNYIGEHYPNVDKDQIDLLEGSDDVIRGSNDSYNSLLNFIENNDLADEENYNYVSRQIDIDNFITYQVFEIFVDNTDWPSNNIKYWKPKTDNGKWRWILVDTDFGFNLFNKSTYRHNTLEFAVSSDTTINYPNPPWSTFLLRNLLRNETFKNKFVNKFANFSNMIFKPQFLENKIDEFKNRIETEIVRHIEKWRSEEITYSDWLSEVEVMKIFARERLSYITSYFIEKFNLDETKSLSLNVSDIEAGQIFINDMKLQDYSWTGDYFSNIPILLNAKANIGYKFIGWQGDYESNENEITLYVDETKNITAVFEKIEDFLAPAIVINEINYNSNIDFNTKDWVELYNNSSNNIDIANWVFKDKKDDHIFIMPENTVIASNNFIVLCRDTLLFNSLFNNQEGFGIENFVGNFDFGLSSNGELIRLYDSENNLIDSVDYKDSSPWPSEPNGTGVTLELKNPELDNSKPENWGISNNYGTPGKENDSYFVTTVKEAKHRIPIKCNLIQNYPNPFNPTTVIKYQIPNHKCQINSTSQNPDIVSLKVYNMLGKEIATLINRGQTAGNYEVTFNAANLSSGIYYYQLKYGNYLETKKMILLK
jgi:hypothetical protein